MISVFEAQNIFVFFSGLSEKGIKPLIMLSGSSERVKKPLTILSELPERVKKPLTMLSELPERCMKPLMPLSEHSEGLKKAIPHFSLFFTKNITYKKSQAKAIKTAPDWDKNL